MHSEPGESLADVGAYRRGVLADAGGEDASASIPSAATAWLATAWLIR
jgi:hypothetical protein